MAVDESQLITWSKAPSDTEDDRCLNAVAMVEDAVAAKFGSKVLIYTQGSHKNRTNIRRDSDVDIVVQHKTMYLNDSSDLEGPDKEIYETEVSSRVESSCLERSRWSLSRFNSLWYIPPRKT